MAILNDSAPDNENVRSRLATPDTILDAFGQFVRAFRGYKDDLEKRETVSNETARDLERAFDRLTSLVSHLADLRARSIDEIRLQEEERRRIARDIHDGPAQTMVWLMRKIEYTERLAAKAGDPAAAEALTDVKNGLKSGLDEMRRIITNLSPPELDDLGLASAIEEYANSFRKRTNMKVEVEWSEHLTLQRDQEILLFRIIQEALNNAAKHSGGSHCRVSLTSRTLSPKVREFSLVVEDDGSGFPSGILASNGGFGLISMQERAEILGGRIAFERSSLGGAAVRTLIKLDLQF